MHLIVADSLAPLSPVDQVSEDVWRELHKRAERMRSARVVRWNERTCHDPCPGAPPGDIPAGPGQNSPA